MLKRDDTYVFGLSVAKNHLTINLFSPTLLASSAELLNGFKVNKHTFTVPADWKVEEKILKRLMKLRLAE